MEITINGVIAASLSFLIVQWLFIAFGITNSIRTVSTKKEFWLNVVPFYPIVLCVKDIVCYYKKLECLGKK